MTKSDQQMTFAIKRLEVLQPDMFRKASMEEIKEIQNRAASVSNEFFNYSAA
jgi:hypothetical protein